ncbi:helix-turn-helix transcriptional regulator [Paenibacillus sp. IB182496]|uniref:Helix-turn-helix transcriptional regulator n=1 Tax=Paenibacillus sabuli TaxID=2772509 RepID=A0A927GU70_9BACL|nr:helix-turn-helix transcriptional regulator [Paenibacillus sabuli]MBD2847845.1 helix-turn-helix transcriptional regulator [Paenibacillus sabuli]
MTEDISYTTEEIAKLLKISKLTVYDLIKKGELPSYRVGKQMRVDASDLQAYKQRAKSARPGAPATSPAAAQTGEGAAAPAAADANLRAVIITGQDTSLDILARHLEGGESGIRPLRSHMSSMDSLIALYKGEADLVSLHLLDGDTGDYNEPYVRRLLVGLPYRIVRLLARQAGLYVQRGNPLGLKSWKDLARPGLCLINREQGSGTRVLLDEQLRLHGIDAAGLAGYDRIATNHLGVAAKVASGEADVGIGMEKAAMLAGAVEFVPLLRECCDLVMLDTTVNRSWIGEVLRIVRSDAFRRELEALEGYDLSEIGRLIAPSGP